MKLALEHTQGMVAVTRTPFVIGRGRRSDLVLDDIQVSQTHARIVETGGAFAGEDLKSLNGVRVNGVRVDGRALLQHGDHLRIGQRGFTVVDTEAAPDPQENVAPEPEATHAGGVPPIFVDFIKIGGRPYAIMPRRDYDRLLEAAGAKPLAEVPPPTST